MEEAVERNVRVETKGNGLARGQYPGPGEEMRPGAAVRVAFSR
jgi:hypothetical protein